MHKRLTKKKLQLSVAIGVTVLVLPAALWMWRDWAATQDDAASQGTTRPAAVASNERASTAGPSKTLADQSGLQNATARPVANSSAGAASSTIENGTASPTSEIDKLRREVHELKQRLAALEENASQPRGFAWPNSIADSGTGGANRSIDTSTPPRASAVPTTNSPASSNANVSQSAGGSVAAVPSASPQFVSTSPSVAGSPSPLPPAFTPDDPPAAGAGSNSSAAGTVAVSSSAPAPVSQPPTTSSENASPSRPAASVASRSTAASTAPASTAQDPATRANASATPSATSTASRRPPKSTGAASRDPAAVARDANAANSSTSSAAAVAEHDPHSKNIDNVAADDPRLTELLGSAEAATEFGVPDGDPLPETFTGNSAGSRALRQAFGVEQNDNWESNPDDIVEFALLSPLEGANVGRVVDLVAQTKAPGYPIVLVRAENDDEYWWVQHFVARRNQYIAARAHFGNDDTSDGSPYVLTILMLDSAEEAVRFRAARQFKELPKGIPRSKVFHFVRRQ